MRRSLFVFALLFAASALACPVCGQGGTPNDPDQMAYKVMTIVLSLLPLAAIGGVVLWIRLRVREHERALEPVAAPTPASAPVGADLQQQNA